MKSLEEFVHENRDGFDSMNPSVGHEEQFKSRLRESKRPYLWFVNNKIAAIITVGMVLSLITFTLIIEKRKTLYTGIDENLKETIFYYSTLNNSIENEIFNRDFNSPIEKTELKKDINDYDKSIDELLKDLKVYPKSEDVKNALIEHLRTKTEMLEFIKDQIDNNNKI